MSPARSQRVRLLLRDLSAGAAFASMALSGELPVWALVAFALTLLCALLGFRPLRQVTVLSGIGLAAGALALYAQAAAGGLDLIVAACSFASLITAQRMLSAPEPRTDNQVLLTSLLMIAGGAALSGELLFAVALAIFATLACFSLLLSVMEGASSPGEQVVAGPAVRLTGAGLAVAMVAAVVLFALFPRLSWNVAGGRISRGLGAASGLGEPGMRLTSSGGSIKTNPRVVARVELSPDPGAQTLDAYFLAGTWGTFTGAAWTDDGMPEAPTHRLTLRASTEKNAALVRQKYELLPALGSNVALAMVEPVMFSGARTQLGSQHGQTRLVSRPGQDVRFVDRADAYFYVAYSAAGSGGLGEAAPLEPVERARYLSLPDDLDPRIAELARTTVGGETDPLRAARRLESHLKQSYGYTLDLPETEGDPVAHFLFERRAGHCEYFASALAILLRTQGIPSRVATGFFGGERSEDDDAYLLRAGDAHAWTQVWAEGRGWVNLDATPEAGRAARPQPVLDWLLRQYERVEGMWRNSVLEYSLRDQALWVTRAWERTRGDGGSLPSAATAKKGGLPSPTRNGWLSLAVGALAGYAVWRVLRVWRPKPVLHPATALRDGAEALLMRHGVAPLDGEGFEEWSLRLHTEAHPAASALAEVVAAWGRARFGGRELPKAVQKSLLARLRTALR